MKLSINLFKHIILIIIALLALFMLFSGGNSPEKLDLVKENSVVELKDGDTFEISAHYIEKEIENKKYKMLSYNGSIPGPTIKVKQGSEIKIIFKNNTDINQLLHSHGVRVENIFDGSQSVQKEMKPGETFTYKIKFPDAGIYWYHPHAHESYSQALGLYGAFLVEPKEKDYWQEVDREEVIFLADLSIENGKITKDKNKTTRTLMGDYGNQILVNGQENYNLNLKEGEVTRLYLINSANARPFDFKILNAKLKRVGGDSGAYLKSTFVDSVILGPSERAIVEVALAAGEYKVLSKDRVLGSIVVSKSEKEIDQGKIKKFKEENENKYTKESVNNFKKYFSKEIDKSISLDVSMGMMDHSMHGSHGMNMAGGPSNKEGIEWEGESMMNDMSDTENVLWSIVDRETSKSNMNIDWSFKVGDVVKIKIKNEGNSMHPMQHPIHFHGQRFLIITRNGLEESNFVLKDTALVGAGEEVELLVEMSNEGLWMAHCHISEHMEAGMMFEFIVNK